MTKNLIPTIAKMLGIAVGEECQITPTYRGERIQSGSLLKFTYCCAYCMHSNDGTPGKICKGYGRILLEKRNDDESAD